MMTVYGRNMWPQCNPLHTLYYYIDVVVYWRYIIYYTITIFFVERDDLSNFRYMQSVQVDKQATAAVTPWLQHSYLYLYLYFEP